jgi:hypothetical protein
MEKEEVKSRILGKKLDENKEKEQKRKGRREEGLLRKKKNWRGVEKGQGLKERRLLLKI